jgi:pimeloyl-ACP methyl ester carboxylesterase
MSDMEGTKALALESFARARGQAFLRFDYRGHGQSSGAFEEGTIGAWAGDAIHAVRELTEGPQILVGSSMGGWMMLLTALALKERIAGLVGIAAAPDFTEDLMWATMPADKRAALERDGVHREPSPYGDAPFVTTMKLIEEGRNHLLLRDAIPLTCPVRLIQGDADPDVPWEVALKLAKQLESDDVEVILVKNGDHRLSSERDLDRLQRVVAALSARI